MITKFLGISPFIIFTGFLVLFVVLFLSLRRVVLWYWKLDEISKTLKEILIELRKRSGTDE